MLVENMNWKGHSNEVSDENEKCVSKVREEKTSVFQLSLTFQYNIAPLVKKYRVFFPSETSSVADSTHDFLAVTI